MGRPSFQALVLCLCLVTLCAGLLPADEPKRPVELGAIDWLRDYDTALDQARRSGKPLLVLFQEVPGWKNCRDYGTQVLSHPLIRDAAESLFVPLCVYNNTKDDADARTLASFQEPAWNNPVVRMLDRKRADLIPRIHDDWTLAALSRGMAEALKRDRKKIPPYLELLAAEQAARSKKVKTALFVMHWFWVGEASLGLVDGVISTLPGFLDGKEVVKVDYNPDVVSLEKLKARAKTAECTYRDSGEEKDAGTVKPDKEPKYYLSKTVLRFVPMTALQATRINGMLNQPGHRNLLSPGQRELLEYIEAHPDKGWKNLIGLEITSAWMQADRTRKQAK